ncbi:uncharacterized protein K441DRAFT_743142 [Cenococcum geophilum 1.58]|uniref:uncharacterized protein n=1 Tax=Cenococcum geophilum 1.58 TaxID=794803 RepID=UPI00358F21CF|nr:hypothetical protein K441DRAFT_743142 [Cenococcum geophilum 1.58]
MANPPIFSELDPLYPIPSPYILQQDELYSSHLALNSSALETLHIDRQVTTGQSHASHLFDPSPAPHVSRPHNAESFNDTRAIPAVPMGPLTKLQKRKAPTLRADT